MKLHIDYDDDYPDPDITIRAAKDSPALAALLARLQPQPKTLAVFQGNREHFFRWPTFSSSNGGAHVAGAHENRHLRHAHVAGQRSGNVAADLPANR